MERKLVSGIALLVFAVMAVVLFKKVSSEEKGILAFKGRAAFSTNSFFDPGLKPELVLDGDASTAWIEAMPGQGTCMALAPRPKPSVAPDERPDCLFIQLDLGFSHSPGPKGPEKNPLKTLRIVNAKDYAHPKQVRLVFFKQEVVDIDREFRLPTLPEFWISREVALADNLENTVTLDFLPPLEDTTTYPGKVKRIWLRIEIQSVYPANKSNVIGISEISYQNKNGSVP